MRGASGLAIGLLIAATLALPACRGGPQAPAGGGEQSAPELFTDLAAESGLDFVHFNGLSGAFLYAEMMGGGAALFDYDGDGDLDAYLVQGEMLDRGRQVSEALFPPRHPLPLTDRLYRNDSGIGTGGEPWLRFVDVTERIGSPGRGYGMGVAAADFDGDGWVDLYVTNLGPNRMLRNRGDGTFSDVTAASGSDDPRWSLPATPLDFDRDGRLDLYVGNYLEYSVAADRTCLNAAGGRDYCGPTAYPGVTDRLFRNLGDGRFRDVSLVSGVGRPAGRTMGAVAADLDADGWLDLYVANDGEPNFLWRNRGDGTFEEVALAAGCAVSGEGLPQASMGVDAADFDRDGDLDLFITHLSGEPNTLFENLGGGSFADRSRASGLGLPSWPQTGFGARGIDFDNDGWQDLLTVNGAVKTLDELVQEGHPYPLAQRNQLFRNLGGGRFEEISERAGAVFALAEVGRGAAFGDVDNDGDDDALVVNSAGRARLLVNRRGQEGAWIGLRVVAGGTGAEGGGAKVAVAAGAGGWRRWRVASDGSYASSSDPRVLVGRGEERGRVEVRVERPGWGVTLWRELPAGRYLNLPAPGSRGGGTEGAAGGEVRGET